MSEATWTFLIKYRHGEQLGRRRDQAPAGTSGGGFDRDVLGGGGGAFVVTVHSQRPHSRPRGPDRPEAGRAIAGSADRGADRGGEAVARTRRRDGVAAAGSR